MGLSSNILWHQSGPEAVRAILESGQLKFAYSAEQIFRRENKSFEPAFPMISLSDLPFSELGNYMGQYADKNGRYAIIGFDVALGQRNGFSPVWYTYRDEANSEYISNILKYMLEAVINAAKSINSPKTGISVDKLAEQPFFEVLQYTKVAEGPLERRNFANYRFADEREVRLCPSIEDLQQHGAKRVLANWDDDNEYARYKGKNGSSLLDFGIEFEPCDVKYLVVQTDDDVSAFRDTLERSFGKNHNAHIFTEREILDNFIGANHNISLGDKTPGRTHHGTSDMPSNTEPKESIGLRRRPHFTNSRISMDYTEPRVLIGPLSVLEIIEEMNRNNARPTTSSMSAAVNPTAHLADIIAGQRSGTHDSGAVAAVSGNLTEALKEYVNPRNKRK